MNLQQARQSGLPFGCRECKQEMRGKDRFLPGALCRKCREKRVSRNRELFSADAKSRAYTTREAIKLEQSGRIVNLDAWSEYKAALLSDLESAPARLDANALLADFDIFLTTWNAQE